MNRKAWRLLCPIVWLAGVGIAIADDSLPLAPGTATVNGNASGQTSPRVSVNLDSPPAHFIQNADGNPAMPTPAEASDPSTSGNNTARHPATAKKPPP